MKTSPLFIITVDTEADNAWSDPNEIRLQNMREIARFQDLCDRHSIPPTYLVTYECAVREEAVSVLQPIHAAGRCEIGHHLHVWTAPPFEQEGPSGIDRAWIHAYQYELPDRLFREKALTLCNAIEGSYGIRPTSHRAGRWGNDERTCAWLVQEGFVADTSSVPRFDYTRNRGRSQGGPDYIGESALPRVIAASEGARLVSIPVTVACRNRMVERLMVPFMGEGNPFRHPARRFLQRFGGIGVLRPHPSKPPGTMAAIMRLAVRARLPVINLMLHSSELRRGCNGVSRTADDDLRVWELLEEAMRSAVELGLEGVTLSDAARRVIAGMVS